MPPQEEGKRLKILTPNKLNSSHKLKNEIGQILYFLYWHNKITKKVYNDLIKSLKLWKKI